jgi:hypothetical protein
MKSYLANFKKGRENLSVVWGGIVNFVNPDYLKVYFNQGKFPQTDKGIKRYKELVASLSQDDVVGAIFYETK